MTTTQPVSYVKAHLAEVIDSVRDSRDPVTITQNGSPSVVLVDHKSYQRTRDALAILKLVAMGEHDVGRSLRMCWPLEEKYIQHTFDSACSRIIEICHASIENR